MDTPGYKKGSNSESNAMTVHIVAEWIHCTLFGIILPTIISKVYTFWGLMNSATKCTRDLLSASEADPKPEQSPGLAVKRS